MPYHLPGDFERFERLTDALNREKPLFTVHVGDIKAGNTPCSDEYLMKIHGYFGQFHHPLIFTPGDNEWTDCHRDVAGSYDPNERLDKIRQIFYQERNIYGSPLMLTSQNTHKGYEKFVENAIWENKGIMFGTFHVVGSNNNLKKEPGPLTEAQEHQERDAANIYWLEELFNQARNNKSQGVILFLHASLNFQDSSDNGFKGFTQRLQEEVLAFEKPILMIYGDHHRFLMEKPLREESGKVVKHFTSLMVFGDKDMHAVEIRVNKKDDSLFDIKQYFVEGN